jgi:hypothetical protein
VRFASLATSFKVERVEILSGRQKWLSDDWYCRYLASAISLANPNWSKRRGNK